MNNFKEVFNSVSEWNSKRYGRVYNSELLVNLLNEETNEYYEADSPVQVLDALCDTAYVAFGGLWKMQVSDTVIESYFSQSSDMIINIVKSGPYPPIGYVRAFIDSLSSTDKVPPAFSCVSIIQTCMLQMLEMLGTSELVFEAISAVCKSNDTKTIKKIVSSEKGYGPKGSYYVSPTAELTKILEKSSANHH
tara:strand:- start:3418 stop:3993 length:576 start_codon:yes stop_codon:yes gene_type:complete